jgi:hypothetical protein
MVFDAICALKLKDTTEHMFRCMIPANYRIFMDIKVFIIFCIISWYVKCKEQRYVLTDTYTRSFKCLATKF